MFDYPARENGLNLIFAGHYQTEVFGVKALMNETKMIFGDKIDTVFLDFPYNYKHQV